MYTINFFAAAVMAFLQSLFLVLACVLVLGLGAILYVEDLGVQIARDADMTALTTTAALREASTTRTFIGPLPKASLFIILKYNKVMVLPRLARNPFLDKTFRLYGVILSMLAPGCPYAAVLGCLNLPLQHLQELLNTTTAVINFPCSVSIAEDVLPVPDYDECSSVTSMSVADPCFNLTPLRQALPTIESSPSHMPLEGDSKVDHGDDDDTSSVASDDSDDMLVEGCLDFRFVKVVTPGTTPPTSPPATGCSKPSLSDMMFASDDDSIESSDVEQALVLYNAPEIPYVRGTRLEEILPPGQTTPVQSKAKKAKTPFSKLLATGFNMKNQRNSIRKDRDTWRTGFQDKVEDQEVLLQKIDNLRAERNGLRAEVDGLRDEIDDLIEERNDLEAERDDLHTERLGLQQRIAELRGQIRRYRRQNQDLRTALATSETNLTAETKKVSDLESDNSTLQNEKLTAEQNFKAEAQKVAKLRKQVTNLQSVIEEKDEELEKEAGEKQDLRGLNSGFKRMNEQLEISLKKSKLENGEKDLKLEEYAKEKNRKNESMLGKIRKRARDKSFRPIAKCKKSKRSTVEEHASKRVKRDHGLVDDI